MRVLGRWVILAAFACVAVLFAREGGAQEGAVSLDYAAPSACPDAEAFATRVRARSPRVRFGPGPRALVVRVEQRRRFVGTLTLREESGAERTRRVEGNTCAELVSGLALVAAIAIDPRALQEGDKEEDAAPSATTEPPADDAGAIEEAPRDHEAGPPEEAWQLAALAGAALLTDVTPDVLFAAPITLEVARDTTRVFAPSARVGFVISAAGSQKAGVGADFVYVAGDLDLCPFAVTPRPLRFRLCARAEIGARAASGTGVVPSRGATRPVFNVGPMLGARLFLSRFFFDAEGGAVFSAVQDRYFVEPSITVFQAPIVGARVGLSVGFVLR